MVTLRLPRVAVTLVKNIRSRCRDSRHSVLKTLRHQRIIEIIIMRFCLFFTSSYTETTDSGVYCCIKKCCINMQRDVATTLHILPCRYE